MSTSTTEAPTDFAALESEADQAVTEWAESLPWWHRPRRMRRQLSRALALVALVSVLLVGGLNFYAASDLLQQGTQDHLVGVAEARTRSIEEGADRLLSRVSALSADLAIAASLEDFDTAYERLRRESTTGEQEAALRDFYQTDFVEPLAEVDVPTTVDEFLPDDERGRYVQYHYTVAGGDDRAAVSDAGDGSAYSAAHARHHEYLRDLAETLGLDDIMLIDTDGNIVYSVAKDVDIGTNILTGVYSDSVLAETINDRLSRSRSGEAVMSDFELYLPNNAQPTGFAMATVRSGSDLLGAFVAEIPIEALNGITTANGEWERVGLEEGESYLVGSDSILRSESRLWIEDPDAYLDRVEDDLLAERIEFLGSPVGIQPADTAAVRAALDGEIFQDRADNYLGQDVFSYARLADVAGVKWVVVADVPYNEARSPLYAYLIRMGITLLILLPLAAAIGMFMADRVTKPIPLILGAAESVVGGDRDPDLPDFGRNEFGDLARRLTRTAHRLGTQESELESQFDETRAVLLAALPPRALKDGTTPTSAGNSHDNGTAISIAVDLQGDDRHIDDSLGDLYASASKIAEQLAAERGIERVRAAADRYLFVAGLNEDGDGADASLELAAEFARRAMDFAAREEAAVDLHIGVSTGHIETGLMTRGSLSYAAWGNPVRNSMVIGSLSTSTIIGVDASTVQCADPDRWSFGESQELTGLDNQTVTVCGLDFGDAASADPTAG